MNESFAVVMAQKSDAELLEVAESPAGTYRDEALQAALSELEKRKIAPRPFALRAAELQATATARATVPLDAGWFLAALLIPAGFFPWLMVASNFERQGYARKARTLRQIAGIGIALVGLALAAAIISATFTPGAKAGRSVRGNQATSH